MSPDFSPIENLWQELKVLINRRLPKNLQEFEPVIIEERKKSQKRLVQISPKTPTRRRRPLIALKKDRKKKFVEPTTRSGGEANATTNKVGFFSSYELRKERANIYPTSHQRTNVAQVRF